MAETDKDMLIIGDCDCGCGCNEVELYSDRQPEVLLFDEYAEGYECDIIQTRELVEEIKQDTDLLPRMHKQICGDAYNVPIRDFIKEELGKIDIIVNQEESTEKEVLQMFDGIMKNNEELMQLPSMDINEEGYVALNMEVDTEGYVVFDNYITK